MIITIPKRLRTFTCKIPKVKIILLTLKSKNGRKKIIAKKPHLKSNTESQNKAKIKKANKRLIKGKSENKSKKAAGRQIREERKANLLWLAEKNIN